MLPNPPLEDQGAASGGAGGRPRRPPSLAHYTSGPFAAPWSGYPAPRATGQRTDPRSDRSGAVQRDSTARRPANSTQVAANVRRSQAMTFGRVMTWLRMAVAKIP